MEEEKVILDTYTILEKDKTRIVYNWLQYFSSESLIKDFEESGLQVDEIYSDVAGTEYQADSRKLTIVARKK